MYHKRIHQHKKTQQKKNNVLRFWYDAVSCKNSDSAIFFLLLKGDCQLSVGITEWVTSSWDSKWIKDLHVGVKEENTRVNPYDLGLGDWLDMTSKT